MTTPTPRPTLADAERTMQEMGALLEHADRHIAQLVAVRDLLARQLEQIRDQTAVARAAWRARPSQGRRP